MNCEKHEDLVSKIIKIDENLVKLNDKFDSKIDIIENKIDSKFENLTSELLKNNKELCESIIKLNSITDTNKKEINKSRNLMFSGVIASISGVIGALITRFF